MSKILSFSDRGSKQQQIFSIFPVRYFYQVMESATNEKGIYSRKTKAF